VEGSDNDLFLQYYPDICPEELRKTMRNLTKYNQSSGQKVNPSSPEWGVGMVSM